MNIQLYQNQNQKLSFKTTITDTMIMHSHLSKSERLIFIISFIDSIQDCYNVAKEVPKVQEIAEAILERYKTYTLSDFALISKLHKQGILKTTCYNAIDMSNIYEIIDQYSEIRQAEYLKIRNEEIAAENERIANAPKPEISAEALKEMKNKIFREHEIMKQGKTLHYTEAASMFQMIIDAYVLKDKEFELTPKMCNQLFHYLEKAKIINLSTEEKKEMHQQKLSEGFSEIEAIYQCRCDLVFNFMQENKSEDIRTLLDEVEFALLSNTSMEYFENIGDEKAVVEIAACKTMLDVNEVIIRHSNIKEKRAKAKKLIKNLPKKQKYFKNY